MKYTYSGRKENGRIFKGVVEAESPSDAIKKIRENGVTAVSLRKRKLLDCTVRRRKITNQDVIFFTNRLRLIIEKGLPLDTGLGWMLEDISRDTMQEVVLDIKTQIETGKSLSAALSSHEKVFPKTYLNLIRTGEKSGSLKTSLGIAADFLETQDNLYNQLKSVILYPGGFLMLSFLVYIAVGLFLWQKIFPTFTQILSDYDVPVTPFRHLFFAPFLFFLIFLLVTLAVCKKTGLSKTVFSMPVLSSIREQITTLSFIKLLGAQLKQNIPLESSLMQAGEILNPKRRARITEAAKLLDAGRKVEDVMEKTGIFNFSELWFIKNGIQSGQMENAMARVAELRETALQMRIGIVSSVIQPFFIILGGIFTGLMVFNIYGNLLKVLNTLLI